MEWNIFIRLIISFVIIFKRDNLKLFTSRKNKGRLKLFTSRNTIKLKYINKDAIIIYSVKLYFIFVKKFYLKHYLSTKPTNIS